MSGIAGMPPPPSTAGSGRRSDLTYELGALAGEDVFDLDLAGNRDAVVGDGRGAELLVENDLAALRTEGDLDCVGDCVDTGLQGSSCFFCDLTVGDCQVTASAWVTVQPVRFDPLILTLMRSFL